MDIFNKHTKHHQDNNNTITWVKMQKMNCFHWRILMELTFCICWCVVAVPSQFCPRWTEKRTHQIIHNCPIPLLQLRNQDVTSQSSPEPSRKVLVIKKCHLLGLVRIIHCQDHYWQKTKKILQNLSTHISFCHIAT